MEKEDLKDWLYSFFKIHPEYSNWSFDDITGGFDNFLDLGSYEDMKEFFQEKYLRK